MTIERIFLTTEKANCVPITILRQLIQTALKRFGSPHRFVIDAQFVRVQSASLRSAAEQVAEENVSDTLLA